MSVQFTFDTDRRDFVRRPTLFRVYGGFLAAWLWFELRVAR